LLDAAESGVSGEVLRFWESPQRFVVVGYANKVATEVNVDACQKAGIPILRRCSGGGTVLQGPGCLNYALVLRVVDNGPTHNISAANQFIMERNRQALETEIRNATCEVRVAGHTDLAIGGRKFSGNSQRRRKGHLLFHGTFLLNFDLELVSALLRFPSHQPNYRTNRNHADFLVNLGLNHEPLKAALIRQWKAFLPLDVVPHERITALVHEKYGAPGWNLKF